MVDKHHNQGNMLNELQSGWSELHFKKIIKHVLKKFSLNL